MRPLAQILKTRDGQAVNTRVPSTMEHKQTLLQRKLISVLDRFESILRELGILN